MPGILNFKELGSMFPLVFGCMCAQKFVCVQTLLFFAKYVHSMGGEQSLCYCLHQECYI